MFFFFFNGPPTTGIYTLSLHGALPIFKEKPQLPSIGQAMNGMSFEWRPGHDDGSEVHYKGIMDDKGRMMAIICHNTDLGDGWEREGENQYYFRNFSEPKAYPMGINSIFYAMAHW